jgi:putative glycosyltransferase (TIGR04372 family)
MSTPIRNALERRKKLRRQALAMRRIDPERRTRRVTLGRRTLLLFDPSISAYGHQALECFYALQWAHAAKADLYLRRRRRAPNHVLYHVTSDVVRNRHASPLLVAIELWSRASERAVDAARDIRLTLNLLEDELRRPVQRRVGKTRFLPARARRRIVRSLKRRADRKPRPMKETRERAYFRRTLIAEPHRGRLCDAYGRRAAAYASELGIPLEGRLVAIHAREQGYKQGREIHDSKPDARNDALRNVSLATYLPAVDRLVALGYTVVRLGDPSMTPLAHDGVIDLTRCPTPMRETLELACLQHSHFLLGCESGPTVTAYLTGTPTVMTNATHVISSYPIRRTDLFILQHIRRRGDDRFLSLPELLGEEHAIYVRDADRFEYVPNTAEEILEVVDEMLVLLEEGRDPSPEQKRFRDLATEAARTQGLTSKYIRKWGADKGFLGDGRIGREQARRGFAAVEPLTRLDGSAGGR